MQPTEQSLAYVQQLPIVQELIKRVESSKLVALFTPYRHSFMTAPAATTQHHNFTHGLVIHTAEVWQAAQKFLDAAPFSASLKEQGTGFSIDELFVAVFLHDFAKIKQYEPSDNYAWAKVRMICNQETWTLRELAMHGISLTDNELVGLLHAEGGYTEFEVDWRSMSVIVHAADLWSSQAMRCFWDPAEVLQVKCPKCLSPMRAINGANGQFYGCTKYAAGCRGTRDGNAVQIEPIFLEWLKKMYPLSS